MPKSVTGNSVKFQGFLSSCPKHELYIDSEALSFTTYHQGTENRVFQYKVFIPDASLLNWLPAITFIIF